MKLKTGIVALLAAAGGFASALPTYHVTDLGTLGGVYSSATGVNIYGQVVGASYDSAGAQHAFLYSGAGPMIDLGTLGGGSSSAYGINDSGVVVGQAALSGNLILHAFAYPVGGPMIDLGTLGTGANSSASAINDSGQIAGFTDTVAAGAWHAFQYSAGTMHDLGTLGGLFSYAEGINASGQLAGYSYIPGGAAHHAFLYPVGGPMTDLGTLGGTESLANGINAWGQVVGWAYPFGLIEPQAFLYSGTGPMTNLGTLGGGNSGANGINDAGCVVGWSNTSGGMTDGFIDAGGIMTDLNSLLDASGSGYTVGEAYAIADNGLIAAFGAVPGGQYHALLLTPNAAVSGTVTLQDFTGSVTGVPVAIEIRLPGTTNVVQRQMVNLGAGGTFSFVTGLTGTYDVAAKASHWLRQRLSSVTFSDTGVSGLSFSLINGDVNGDDTINLADLLGISKAWRSTAASPNWNPNADLNGDGTVNLADWLIVSKNWRKSGDP